MHVQRVHEWLRVQQLSGGPVPCQLGIRVAEGVAAAASGNLGEIRDGGLAGLEQGLRLQRRQADCVGPQRGDVVGVELPGQDLVYGAGCGLAVAVDEGGVDVAELELHPGLVERPRPVHLDMALLDRRPRSDAVKGRHEAERLA